MLRAFHSNWTRPFFAHHPDKPYRIEAFELLTTALSALSWRDTNGSICMICDSIAKQYYDALDLTFLWDDGIHPLLDAMPTDINPTAFWAAGKLYALSAMPSPCVMIDTDFIVWKPIEPLLRNLDVAAIHAEDIMPDIYPDAASFTQTSDFDFSVWDWSVHPFNTALTYMSSDVFRHFYTDTAIRFMRASASADHLLTYMVFAEQRLLAMCAAEKKVRAAALSDLAALFGGAQNGYFTHIWGFKQQMRDDPLLYEDFCRRCAARLQRAFPEAAAKIARIPLLSPYFIT